MLKALRLKPEDLTYYIEIKLDQNNSRIFLPKLGWIRYRNSREILGEVRNVTVSFYAGKWFMSIQTRREVETPIHPSGTAVGIDMGIVRFATLSDGTFYEPLNSFRKHERVLARHQRSLSRKKKRSKNWEKAKRKLQKRHVKIANVRRDFLHKATTAISKNHAVVCVEDLQIRNMSKSSKGTAESPGRNVRAKSGLNKAILDQGWFEFRRQLEYKMGWRGGSFVAVPPQHTSQICPNCGYVSGENRRTQSNFACIECGFEENADVVGAMNVLARGHRVTACGEKVHQGRSMKQEPAEVIRNSNTVSDAVGIPSL
jgi:putative transposase